MEHNTLHILILWIKDVAMCGVAITACIGGLWLAMLCIGLSVMSYYEHNVIAYHRLMERFSRTTNYPQYEKYQDKLVVNAKRLERTEKFLSFLTFS